MHRRLMDLTNVALYELETSGPELVGMIEVEMNERHLFEGALIPTTKRLCVNVFDADGNILKREINLKDITHVRLRKQFLLDDTLEISVGSQVLIRMHGVRQHRTEKFMDFVRRHREKLKSIEDNEMAV